MLIWQRKEVIELEQEVPPRSVIRAMLSGAAKEGKVSATLVNDILLIVVGHARVSDDQLITHGVTQLHRREKLQYFYKTWTGGAVFRVSNGRPEIFGQSEAGPLNDEIQKIIQDELETLIQTHQGGSA